MGFTPDTIKQTLLGFISSQAAVSEKYTTIQNAFTRTRKITFSDAISSVYEVPFETTTANIAIGNDNCLRKTYGDYMQLPPEEERGMHHQTEIFYDPFKSYIEYENSKEVKDFFGL